MRRLFEGLYGNEAAKSRLSSAVLGGTLAHAFLIDGPDGSGKNALATEISMALNCENKDDPSRPLPCRGCNTCRRILEGSYTDVKRLFRQKGKATIGVDAVKDFKEDMFLTSTESEFKVYVIDGAESLTVQSQNALLTVMEEPPPGVVIFLLSSSSDKILTTIKSRAQYIAMERFSPEALDGYLSKNVPEAVSLKTTSPETYSAVLMKADGCIGKAKELLDSDGAKETEAERQRILRILAALDVRIGYGELYSALLDLSSVRAELIEALESLAVAVGDLIKIKTASSEVITQFYHGADAAAEAAKAFSIGRLHAIYDMIFGAIDEISKNASTATVLVSLAAKIKLI